MEEKIEMSEYLVLLKLNPGKIIDTLGALRSLPPTPVPGVDVCYAMNIFGAWDVGIWIDAENSSQALEFVQKKVSVRVKCWVRRYVQPWICRTGTWWMTLKVAKP